MPETKRVLSSVKRDGTPSLNNEILCPKCNEPCHIAVEAEFKTRKRVEWEQIYRLTEQERVLLIGRLTRLTRMYEYHIRENHNLSDASKQRYLNILEKLNALKNYRVNHNSKDGAVGVWFTKKYSYKHYLRLRTYHRMNGKQKWCYSRREEVEIGHSFFNMLNGLTRWISLPPDSSDPLARKVFRVWNRIHRPF